MTITKTLHVSPEVRAVLLGDAAAWTNQLDGSVHLKITAKLDRKLYTACDKVLVALGGKWNRKAQAHVFAVDPRPQMPTDAAPTVTVEKWDFFPTPPPIADRMAALLDLKPGIRVLEPSAGEGALIEAVFRAEPTADLSYIEQHPGRHAALAAKGFHALILPINFLDLPLWFARIIMNPPWTNYQDRAHLIHAWNCLDIDGILVAAITHTAAFSPSANLREIYAKGLIARYPLPPGTFPGTNARGAIVKLGGKKFR